MTKLVSDIEKTDVEERLNNVTRRLILEIVKEQITPMQLNTNLELKAIRKLVEEQRNAMEEYRNTLRRCVNELDDFRLTSHYDNQNNKQAGEAYMRELVRM